MFLCRTQFHQYRWWMVTYMLEGFLVSFSVNLFLSFTNTFNSPYLLASSRYGTAHPLSPTEKCTCKVSMWYPTIASVTIISVQHCNQFSWNSSILCNVVFKAFPQQVDRFNTCNSFRPKLNELNLGECRNLGKPKPSLTHESKRYYIPNRLPGSSNGIRM